MSLTRRILLRVISSNQVRLIPRSSLLHHPHRRAFHTAIASLTMSTPLQTSSSSTSAPAPSNDSSIWSSLSSITFRHAKVRDADLPTRFLHVSFEVIGASENEQTGAEAGGKGKGKKGEAKEDATNSNPTASSASASASAATPAPLTRETIYSVFASFGELDGVFLLPQSNAAGESSATSSTSKESSQSTSSAASSAPSATPTMHSGGGIRRVAYISYVLKQHAAHAAHALHQKASSILPGYRLHVHHAVVKGTPASTDESKSDSSSSSQPITSLSRPSGLTLTPTFLTPSSTKSILASIEYLLKGSVSYGAHLKEEDDFTGLRKPKGIDQAVFEEVLKKTVNDASSSSSAAAAASASATIDQTRLTLTILQPGQGLKRTIESRVYADSFSLINLGPSHTIVELYPLALRESSNDKVRHTVYVPAGTALRFESDARKRWEYAIPAKTRDIIPQSLIDASENSTTATAAASETSSAPSRSEVNLKRTRTTLLFVRQVVDINADEDTASSASAAAPSGKKGKLSSKSDQEEKVEKRVHSTAMQLPSASNETDVESAAASMEALHVRGVYDAIATHFSSTRHSPWPRIESFVESVESGLDVADIGCGNGKYMGLNSGIKIRGMDSSAKLVEICRTRGYDVIEGDIMQIPFEKDMFDVVLCIAVLHHLSTPKRRAQAVRELMRITRKGGRILISAWAYEQDVTSRREFPSQDVLVPWNVPRRYIEEGGEKEQAEQVAKATVAAQQAAAAAASAASSSASSSSTTAASSSSASSSPLAPLVDPSSGTELVQFQRYCHVYKSGELEELFTQEWKADEEIQIVDKYYDRGNWCVVVKKL